MKKMRLGLVLAFALPVAACIGFLSCVSMASVDSPREAERAPLSLAMETQVNNAEISSRIDSFLSSRAMQGNFSGSVLVAVDGEVVLEKGYGYANAELSVPNDPKTKFRIGSVTKQFTAAAIMLLKQQGKLDLGDPISRHIADCPEAWREITVFHLLAHTSGIVDFTRLPDYADMKLRPSSPEKIMGRIGGLPLEFRPGERWSYSNSGYILLGKIIEAASGAAYETYLRDAFFDPLGMQDTGYDSNSRIIERRASGYTAFGTYADYIDMSVPFSAGGLYSTVEDLYRWDQALYGGAPLTKESEDELWAPRAAIPGSDLSYGYGWIIGTHWDRRCVFHGGAIEGFSSAFDRYVDDRVTVIVLSNMENIDLSGVTATIAALIFG